jgi:hypothetical protein
MTHQAQALGLACCILFLSSLTATRPARAEEPAPPPTEPALEPECTRDAHLRVVNGHRFIPFQIVTWPLVTTRFTAITSAGALWAELRSDQTTTLVTLQENFQLQWAIARWIGVEGHLLGSTAAATGVRDILRTGLSYAYGGRAALVARFLERGPWYFSGRFDGQQLRFQSFVPERILEGVDVSSSGVDISGARITQTGRAYRIRPSLNLAVGIARWFGVQVSAAVDIDHQSLERANDQTYTSLDIGLGTSFDLGQIHLPLSILLGGRIVHDFGGNPVFVAALQPSGRNRGQTELALYYSGRPGVDIGLAVRMDIGSGESALLVSPVINYVW